MDRVASGLLALVAFAGIAGLLGSQSARIGPIVVPPLSPWWVVSLALLLLIVAPKAKAPSSMKLLLTGAAMLSSLLVLHSIRGRLLDPPTRLEATLEEGGRSLLPSLRLERRNELRRISGRRRNFAFEAKGTLEVPRDGLYAIEAECDDSCEIAIGETALRAAPAVRAEVELAAGDVPLAIRYRQEGGPARLVLRWDRPALVELLPMDYFVRPGDGAARSRIGAHLALGALALWWTGFAFYLRALARARDQWKRSALVPAAIAALVVSYGALLRFESFLTHSDLASRGGRAAAIHESLLPWLPSWGIFNPENAPEDPYRADVRSYLDRAQAMAREGFYAPSFREPFYVLVVRGFVALADGEIGILVESFSFSVLTLVLFYFVARRLHGAWWAAALLVPIALHQWLVLDAPTGYREACYSFFLLALLAAVVSGSACVRWGAAAGILAGLLCLIRLSALSIVVPLLGLKAWSIPRGERARYAGVFAAAAALLIGPFLWSNYRAHGDPLYSVSFHTEFWLRAEGLDASQGPVSLSSYFADPGRARSVIQGTLLGLTVLPIRTFWNGLRDFPVLGVATLALGVTGLLLVKRGANRYLTAAYLGHLAAFAYIQNFPSGEMPRFVMPAYYLLVLAAPSAVWRSGARPGMMRPPR